MAAARVITLRKAIRKPAVSSLRSIHNVRTFSTAPEKSVLFPNERYGVCYRTNWEISSLGVSVQGEAFKNAGDKTLAMHSGTYDRAEKTLGLGVDTDGVVFEGIDENTFDEIETDARDVLSNSSVLFLNDALPTAQLAVRTLTDTAAYSKLFSQLMNPASLERCGERPLEVLHSSVPDQEAAASYCAVGPNKVIIRGTPSPTLVVEAIAKSAALQTGQLALPGYLVVNTDGTLVQLVAPSGLETVKLDGKVVGSGASLIVGGEVHPLCRSILASAPTGGETRVSVDGTTLTPLEVVDVEDFQLKKVVLLSGSKLGSSKKVDMEKAKELYAAMGWSSFVDKFESVMTDNGIEVYKA